MKNPEAIFETTIIITTKKINLKSSDFFLSNCLTTSMNENIIANDMNLSAIPPLTIADQNNVAVMQYRTKISNFTPFLTEFNKTNVITPIGMIYVHSPKCWKML